MYVLYRQQQQFRGYFSALYADAAQVRLCG